MKTLTLVLLLLQFWVCAAQRPTIAVYYTDHFTLANFKPHTYQEAAPFREIFDTDTTARWFAGSALGGKFLYPISDKFSLGLALQSSRRGLSSGFGYDYGNRNRPPELAPAGFGGMNYVIELRSRSLSILSKMILREKNI